MGEELAGQPKAGDLLGDLRTLALDEGDPVTVAAASPIRWPFPVTFAHAAPTPDSLRP
jgi:hypothetical protein